MHGYYWITQDSLYSIVLVIVKVSLLRDEYNEKTKKIVSLNLQWYHIYS